jgi:hypothetical protein
MIVYLLCGGTALVCTLLLLRGFSRTGARLLLWSALCFGCLTLNNFLTAIDLAVFPDVDLFLLRNATALIGLSALIYGLVWEAK